MAEVVRGEAEEEKMSVMFKFVCFAVSVDIFLQDSLLLLFNFRAGQTDDHV